MVYRDLWPLCLAELLVGFHVEPGVAWPRVMVAMRVRNVRVVDIF